MQTALSPVSNRSLTVRIIDSREQWDDLHRRISPPTFLQSWEWGEFQKAIGERITRLGVFDGEELVAGALLVIVRAKRGSFVFCPHGPISQESPVTNHESRALELLIEKFNEIASQEKCVCVRISSLFSDTPKNQDIFRRMGFRKAPTFMHPELAWILDITPDEQTLLSNMRKTTRYSIKKAEKEGVVVTATNDATGLDAFYRVYEETRERQNFVPFSRRYLAEEWNAFAPDNIQFFFAHYQGNIVATAIIVYSSTSAFYHHGASTHPKVPAPYLLQWHAILEAKRRGCTQYNFWGIAPQNQPKHPWAGLTLFKIGFGGSSHGYVPAQDIVLRPSYWFLYAIEWLRRKKRRL